MCEDFNVAQWREIIDLISGEDEPPIPLVSEDWFELVIIHDPEHNHLPGVRQLSSEEIPTTCSEGEELVRSYVVEDGETNFSLRNA